MTPDIHLEKQNHNSKYGHTHNNCIHFANDLIHYLKKPLYYNQPHILLEFPGYVPCLPSWSRVPNPAKRRQPKYRHQ
jgi:hypothetical protein